MHQVDLLQPQTKFAIISRTILKNVLLAISTRANRAKQIGQTKKLLLFTIPLKFFNILETKHVTTIQ